MFRGVIFYIKGRGLVLCQYPFTGWQYTYDAQGNLRFREDACGQETGYSYDSLNRLVKIVWPDNSETNYTYDALNSLTQMQDAGGTTTYTYDKLKRLKSQVYPDGAALNYSYDLNGSRSSLNVSGAGQISYAYDSLNRLSKIVQPDGKTAQYSYDALSRRTQLNYPNGAITTYTYDPAGRLTQLINKDKSAQEMSKYIYTCNAAGDRIKTALLDGTTTYDYDQTRQLIAEHQTRAAETFAQAYQYDNAGNRLIRKTSSVPENYSYNNLNQLISQTSGASTATEKYIQVKGSVGDANLQSVKVNGVNAQVSGGQFTADNVLLKSGQNTITAEAVDAAGNTGSHQIKVTYQPGGSAQKLITVQGNVSDASPVSVKVNGITATVSAGQWTANNVPLNPGQNTIVGAVA